MVLVRRESGRLLLALDLRNRPLETRLGVAMRGISRLSWLALVFMLAGPAVAGEEASAQAFMKDKQTELSGLVKKGGASEKKKVETVFDSILDYDALAQDSLRDHWKDRSDAERR